MPKFRLASLAQLARQMDFAPQDVRAAHIERAENLLYSIDPAKGYPLDFVIYRITEYRPRENGNELLTGLALQHDLGLFIEKVSQTLELQAAAQAQPVLDIEDVCRRFNVTSKTIQRWRRRGLPARHFVFADGKCRVGFLLGSVERFFQVHREQAAVANCSEIGDSEYQFILRNSRRLAQCGCTAEEIGWRLARRLRRSPSAILHTLRKHDEEDVSAQVLRQARAPLSAEERATVLRAWRRQVGLGEIAALVGRPRSTVLRAVLAGRIARLSRRKVRFHDDPLFHQPDALGVIDSLTSGGDLDAARGEEQRVPRDLPSHLQELYRTPLLGRGRERALFLKLNYHKYQFVQLRRQLDPELAGRRELDRLEAELSAAAQVKQAIVRANLRLVVSVAKRHLSARVTLMELMSEGAVTLMRAVDGFDIARGNRFSTYATLALMKGFARGVPQLLGRGCGSLEGDPLLASVPDARPPVADRRLADRDEVGRLLACLSERERRIVSAHFGVGESDEPATYEQVGRRLGLSKERVRQIELGALAKLRAAVGTGLISG